MYVDRLIYWIATRRLSTLRVPQAEYWDEKSVAQLLGRTKPFRRVLLGTLVIVGVASFIEIVALPGALIRTTFANSMPPTPTPQIDDQAPKFSLETLLMSDEEKRRQQEMRRQRMEDSVRSSHRALGAAIVRAQDELDRSRSTFGALLHLPGETTQQFLQPPAELAKLFPDYPTSLIAWKNLKKTWGTADQILASAKAQHSLGAQRLAANSYLPEDQRDFDSTSRQLDSIRAGLQATRSDLHHLDVLLQADALVTHPPHSTTSIGGTP